jgi:transcriptional regulator with XRE-family HTH domain
MNIICSVDKLYEHYAFIILSLPRSKFGLMETHHGQQLKRYFDSLDLSYEQIRRRLHIGSRNTLTNWLNRERLAPHMLQRIAQHMPDAMRMLTDVEWVSELGVNNLAEPVGRYGMNPKDEECRKELNRWKDRYIELLTDYNDMLRRHIELQEQMKDR